MTENDTLPDPWRFALLLLWQLVFLVGLVPEVIFLVLRRVGAVSTFSAMVNSPAVITIALSFYVALFAWRRCREWDIPAGETAGKAFQFGLFAAMAFMVGSFRWDEPGIMILLWHIREIPIFVLQAVVFAMAFAKLTAWLYLFIIFFRYYVLGEERVFADTASIFPSSYARAQSKPLDPPIFEEPKLPE